MRIALLATEIDFARPAGGAARYAIEAWRELSSRGHDVRLVCYGPGTPADPPGVERLPVGRVPIARALGFSRAVGARLLADPPDVVIANYPLLARHVRELPVVIVVHSTMHGLRNAAGWSPRGLAERLARRGLGAPHERVALAGCRVAVCVGEHVAQEVVASGALPASRTRLIPGGVDVARFSPPTARPAASPFRLICAGRLIPLKRIDLAIAALEHLRAHGTEATLEIAGDGPERGRLRRLAATSSASAAVCFLGALDTEALASAYGRAHALLLPSRHEGLPLAALEAMACGLPVVATAFPGVAELVAGGEHGMVVLDDSPAGVAAALARAIADPAWAARGARAREWVVRHHAWETIVGRLEAVLADVVAARGDRA